MYQGLNFDAMQVINTEVIVYFDINNCFEMLFCATYLINQNFSKWCIYYLHNPQMSDKRPSTNESNEKFPIYNSPSRFSVLTPVRSALRSSNNNVFVFLDKLKQLNKFKNGIEKLSLEKEKGKENNPEDSQ